jgi:hypothetical protein
MNIYKSVAIGGLYLMSISPIMSSNIEDNKGNVKYNKNKTTINKEITNNNNNNNNKLTKVSNLTEQTYTFVVSVGDINPTEGVGIQIIHNKDTINTQTNYIGLAFAKAYLGDTIKFYPTEKSGQFKDLEMVLNKTFNDIKLEPQSEIEMTLKK